MWKWGRGERREREREGLTFLIAELALLVWMETFLSVEPSLSPHPPGAPAVPADTHAEFRSTSPAALTELLLGPVNSHYSKMESGMKLERGTRGHPAKDDQKKYSI